MNLKSRMTVGPNDGSEAAKCRLTVVLVASPTAKCRVCRVGLVAPSDEAHATIGLCADEVWRTACQWRLIVGSVGPVSCECRLTIVLP